MTSSHSNRWTRAIGIALLLGSATLLQAATPPELINFQGVLRDGDGNPAGGSFGMRFVFYDDTGGAPPCPASGGTLLLIDEHAAVQVSQGLFNVGLGSGIVTPGTATTLAEVFRDHAEVHVEIVVGTETLCPRVRVISAAYSMNSDHLDGKDAAEFLDTSSTSQVKTGDLTVADLQVGGRLTIAGGAPAAGRVLTSDGSGLARWQEPQGSVLGALADRLGAPDPSSLPFAELGTFDCSGGNSATLSFSVDAVNLGDVVGFVGSDRISAPYDYLIAIETTGPVSPEAQIGQPGRLTLQRAGGTTTFSGRITEFGLAAHSGAVPTYVARLEPGAVDLERTTDHRIFSSMHAAEILQTLLNESGLSNFEDRLVATPEPFQMAIQYNESSLGFISRLLEEEGIHYHFEEGASTERLVYGDTNAAFAAVPGSFNYHGDMLDPGTGEEFLSTFHARTRQFTGKASVGGYDFTNPTGPISQGATEPGGTGEFYEFVEAGLTTPTAGVRARKLLDREQVRRSEHTGTGNVAHLKAGHLFTLNDLTPAGLGGSYAVTGITHFARRDPSHTCINYGNVFTAVPSATVYAPPRRTPKPRVHGPITAKVTGPAGEEIYTDEYGRVKVQFHWDREGSSDENSSAWIRVATPTGKTDRDMFLPQVGTEVLVDFVQGDPSQPVVIGSMYNADHLPLLQLPDNRARTELITDAIRLTDSLVMGSALDVGASLGGDVTAVVNNDLALAVGRDAAVNVSNAFDMQVGANMTLHVGGAADLTVGGNHSVTVGGSLFVNGNTDTAVSTGRDLDFVAGRDVGLAASGKFILQSGSTLLANASAIQLEGDGFVRSMIDDDNNSTLQVASWHHNGSYTGASKLAELQEDGDLRIRGALSQFVAFDIAESFLASEALEPGDLVRLDPQRPGAVRRSTGADDRLVLGVISRHPGVLLGGAPFDPADLESVWGEDLATSYRANRAPLREWALAAHDELRLALADLTADADARQELEARIESVCLERFYADRFAAVTLAGRVPVKVDASYGAIEAGDALAPSPLPGVAMKATRPGLVIGIALEGLSEERGEVLTFIDRGHYSPPDTTEASGISQQPADELELETPDPLDALPTLPGHLRIALDQDADDRARFSILRDAGGGLSQELMRLDEDGNLHLRGALRPSALDLAEYHRVNEPVEPGDVLVVDREEPGVMRRARMESDPAVVGIVSAEPGVLLGSGSTGVAASDPGLAAEIDLAHSLGDRDEEARLRLQLERRFRQTHAPIALSGTVLCKVDAGYGAIRVGDLLTTSATAGHAMGAPEALPGTIIGKALEPLDNGTGLIKVLVMLR